MKVCGWEHVTNEREVISVIFLGDRTNTTVSQHLEIWSVQCPPEEDAYVAAK